MTQGEMHITDRVDIDDLLTRYATAIDSFDWEMLDTVFTPDAWLDYRTAGGIAGPYPEVRAWLAQVLPMFEMTQHVVTNRVVTVDGVHGRARSSFVNPTRTTIDGKPWQSVVGGYYHDELVRTGRHWRIARRVEETLWWDNPMPGMPAVPAPLDASVASVRELAGRDQRSGQGLGDGS